MQLKKCFLKNFRNYTAGVASFDEHINLIVGNNAQGKTNLLEAIYFCALGKSPRTKKEVSLIQADKDNAYISLDFHTMAGDKNIEIVINRVGKKQIKIKSFTQNFFEKIAFCDIITRKSKKLGYFGWKIK